MLRVVVVALPGKLTPGPPTPVGLVTGWKLLVVDSCTDPALSQSCRCTVQTAAFGWNAGDA